MHLDSEQGDADHIPYNILYVMMFVNLMKFQNYQPHKGPIKLNISVYYYV